MEKRWEVLTWSNEWGRLVVELYRCSVDHAHKKQALLESREVESRKIRRMTDNGG